MPYVYVLIAPWTFSKALNALTNHVFYMWSLQLAHKIPKGEYFISFINTIEYSVK